VVRKNEPKLKRKKGTVTVEEASKRLKAGINQTYDATKPGGVLAAISFRIGRRIFISEAGLDRLVDGNA